MEKKMAIMTLKKILHLPVETHSGIKLGTVSGAEIDVEQHVVMRYVVKSSHLPRPLASELLIAPSQVINITEEKMIVEDAAAPPVAAVITPAV